MIRYISGAVLFKLLITLYLKRTHGSRNRCPTYVLQCVEKE
jgi:hypothetical protein